MAEFVNDTFVETGSNVTLQNHTGETGATWAQNSVFSQDLQVSASSDNVAQGNSGSSSAVYYASGSPSGNEYDVECDIQHNTALTDNANHGPAGRLSTSADTMYFTRNHIGNARWELYKVIAGSYTLFGTTYSQTLSADTAYAVKLELRDAAKKVFIDSVERLNWSDDAITADGKAGMRWSLNQAADFEARMDNFTATDAAAGGATSKLVVLSRHRGR